MNEILFRAHGRKACVAFCGDLTSGSVGLPIKFEFDSAWDGLQKTAIFKGSGTTVDVVLTGDTAVVPAEVMEDSGLSLKVGVWGAAPDGNVVIPTVWVEVGKIRPGAEPSGIDPHPPAPSWAAQVQQIATEALTNSEEAVATANATEARMTALEQEIAGDVEQAREYAQQAQAAAESAGADAQTASAAAQTAWSAASTASAAAATATEKAADTARDATAAQEAASEAETAKEAAETAAQSIQASAAQIEQNRQDIADLDTEVSQQKSAIEDLQALTNRKAGMLVDTVSGAIASCVPDATIPNLLGVTVDIEPVQDLHGFDHPWPAGGGKNKLKNNLTSSEINGVTATVDADGVISFSGTSTAITVFNINVNIDTEFSKNTNYVLSGCSGGDFYTYRLEIYKRVGNNAVNYNGDTQFQLLDTDSGCSCRIVVQSGINMSGVKIYPMIRLATDTDATYAPYENICPISGWDSVEVERTGVNLWDEEWEVGDISADTGQNVSASTVIRSKNFIPVEAGQQYYFHINSQGAGIRTRWYGKDKTYLGSSPSIQYNSVFTVPNNAYFLRFTPQSSYGTTYNHDISINYPSTDHAYHPYAGNHYTIQLGDTVYGGTLDVTNGTLTVDRAMVDLGTLTWIYRNGLFDASISGGKLKGYATGEAKAVCTEYAQRAKPYTKLTDGEMAFGTGYVNSATCSAILKNSTYTSAADFKSAMSWVMLVYDLATPITIQLDTVTISAIAGQTNNVWADAGDVSVEFAADLKHYIDSKISALAAQIVNS